MSDKLVPIALSSEIDSTGTERVHAAPYTPAARSTWIYTPPYNDSYLISVVSGDINGGGGSGYALSYTKYDTTTNALVEVSTVNNFRTNFGMNMSCRYLNNFVFMSGMYEGVAPSYAAYAFSLNNSNVLTQRAFWEHDTEPGGTIGSLDVAEVAGEIYVYFIYWGPLFVHRYRLICLRFNPLTYTFTKIGDTIISNSITYITSAFQRQFPSVVVHKGYIVTATYENGLTPDDGTSVSFAKARAYSFDGTNFTLVSSLSLTGAQFNRPDVGSFTSYGDYISLGGNFQPNTEQKPILKMATTTLEVFTPTPFITGNATSTDTLIPLTVGSNVFYYAQAQTGAPSPTTSLFRIYSCDAAGVMTLVDTKSEGYIDYSVNRVAAGTQSGVARLYLGLYDTAASNSTGVYDWDGSGFVKKGTCIFPYGTMIYNEFLSDMQEIPQLTSTGP